MFNKTVFLYKRKDRIHGVFGFSVDSNDFNPKQKLELELYLIKVLHKYQQTTGALVRIRTEINQEYFSADPKDIDIVITTSKIHKVTYV